MDHLMKLVTTALELSYAEAEIDVSSKHLEAAAGLLLQRDTIRMIDGAEPSVEVHPPEQEQGSVPQTETGETPVRGSPKRRRKKTEASVGANAEVEGQSPSDGSEHSPAVDPPKRRRKKTGDSVTENVEAATEGSHLANGGTSSTQVDAGSPVLPTKPKRTRRAGEPKPKQNPAGEVETEHTA